MLDKLHPPSHRLAASWDHVMTNRMRVHVCWNVCERIPGVHSQTPNIQRSDIVPDARIAAMSQTSFNIRYFIDLSAGISLPAP